MIKRAYNDFLKISGPVLPARTGEHVPWGEIIKDGGLGLIMSAQRVRLLRSGLIGLALVLLLSASGAVYAQDYTIEVYNEYQDAVARGEDALIAFIKKYPDSSLKQYAIGSYVDKMKAYMEAGKHQETVTAGEKFLASVDPELYDVLFLTTWSAFYSQQYDKAIKYGEKVYAAKPDAPQIVPILARAYLNTGNTAKAVEFGEKYCSGVAPQECYDLLPTITRLYAENKDWAKAEQYAKQTIAAFDAVQKPAQVADAEWTNFVNEEKSVASAIMGRQAFESKKWAQAEKFYTDSRKLNPKNKARKAEGWYYIGMARWSQDKIDPAMEAFARGSWLEGTAHADACKKQLEKLYRATHNGSVAGMDEFMERFKSGE